MSKKILIFAGEVSGAKHGINLMQQLNAQLPDIAFFGAGDDAMIVEGLQARYTLADLQVYGLIEVIAHLPRMLRILNEMEQWAIEEKPDLAILIDYPGFNLRLGQRLRQHGIPVILINGPQIWAWRAGRIHQIQKAVDRVIVFFEFETEIYQKAGVDVFFAGHPSVKKTLSFDEKQRLCEDLKLTSYLPYLQKIHQERSLIVNNAPIVAVLPGSRPGEIQRHWSLLQESMHQIRIKYPHAKFLVPLQKQLPEKEVADFTKQGILIVRKTAQEVFALANVAIVASGTATLEATMSHIPFIIIYRASYLSYWIAKRLAKIEYLGMVNILAQRLVVPELIQQDCNVQNIVSKTINLIENEDMRKQMIVELQNVCQSLGETGAYSRMTANIVDFLHHQNQKSTQD